MMVNRNKFLSKKTMFTLTCLFSCFIRTEHIALKESTRVYMSNQTVLIGGKNGFSSVEPVQINTYFIHTKINPICSLRHSVFFR